MRFERRIHRWIAIGMAAVMLAGATACTQAQPAEVQGETVVEVLSQRPPQEGRIPVTVLVKNAFTIHGFEKIAEEKFPQLDIIQVGNYTSDRGMVEYARRIKNDDLTDVIMTWPLAIGEEYWEERLLDLSGMAFTGNYNTSMLNSIARDGKLFYLPGPAQVRGFVYNKTLFEENGWQVPHDLEGFLELCRTIEAAGIRPIQLGFKNSEVLDTAFIGASYGNCYSKPGDVQWIADYNAGKGSFGDHFTPALDTFQLMIDAGIWRAADLQVDYAEREKMLFTRKCAMVEDSVLLAGKGEQLTGSTDEFALMPFFCPDEQSDWARLYMVCYIGLNKHLAEPQNEEKFELIKELMAYISTAEGQEALAMDTGAMYSSVKDVPAPDIPEIADLVDTLNHGRYAIFPELDNAQDALREGLAGMLAGTHTQEDVIRMVDEQNRNPTQRHIDKVIGEATEDFTLIETGNFITDVMREHTGAEIALFLDNGKDGINNGKGVSGRLYAGPQTEADVIRILPDMRDGERGVVQVVEIAGKNLINTLKYAIPVDNNIKGWFYYFSGLRVEYDPVAEAADRILQITDEQGNPLEDNRVYRVAVMDKTYPEVYALSVEDSDVTIKSLLIEKIKAGPITPSDDDRFTLPDAN